jgi:hypothetical protein
MSAKSLMYFTTGVAFATLFDRFADRFKWTSCTLYHDNFSWELDMFVPVKLAETIEEACSYHVHNIQSVFERYDTEFTSLKLTKKD